MSENRESKNVYVSIVVPARNEEGVIERLLDSIEKSEYEDFEVIVVDGGSSDDTRSIAQEYDAEVIEGPQEGTAVARNIGWRNANGQVIYFMDADWFFGEGTLQAVAREFKNGAKIVVPNHDHHTTNWVDKAVSAENKFGYKSKRAQKIRSIFNSVRGGVPWL